MEILSTFTDFGMGLRRDALFPLVGEGIFTQDGAPWKHSREMLRRPFSKTRYQDLQGFGENTDKLIAKLSSSSGVVDLQRKSSGSCNFLVLGTSGVARYISGHLPACHTPEIISM